MPECPARRRFLRCSRFSLSQTIVVLDNYLSSPNSLRRHSTTLWRCFSEQDSQFGGSGKYRDTPLGTRLYFSSETELRELFAPGFEVLGLRTIEVRGKHRPHLAICAFMQKKSSLPGTAGIGSER